MLLSALSPLHPLAAQTSIAENDFFANAITDYISFSRKLELYIIGQETTLDGKLAIGSKEQPPELIRLKGDLSFGDELITGFGLRWHYADRTSADLKYTMVKHSSSLSQSRFFKGKKFKTASAFNVKNRWLDLEFTKKLYRTQTTIQNEFYNNTQETLDRARLASVFGVKVANMVITARGEEAGELDKHLYANWEKTFLLPYVGVKSDLRLGKSVDARAHALYSNFPTLHGYHADMYELGFNLIFDMHRKDKGNIVQLDVGYLKSEQDIDGKGNGILFKFDGPTLALNVIF